VEGAPRFPAVKDPNSNGLGPVIDSSVPESGYYTGESANFSLGTIDIPQPNVQPAKKEGQIAVVRPVASEQDLLSRPATSLASSSSSSSASSGSAHRHNIRV